MAAVFFVVPCAGRGRLPRGSPAVLARVQSPLAVRVVRSRGRRRRRRRFSVPLSTSPPAADGREEAIRVVATITRVATIAGAGAGAAVPVSAVPRSVAARRFSWGATLAPPTIAVSGVVSLVRSLLHAPRSAAPAAPAAPAAVTSRRRTRGVSLFDAPPSRVRTTAGNVPGARPSGARVLRWTAMAAPATAVVVAEVPLPVLRRSFVHAPPAAAAAAASCSHCGEVLAVAVTRVATGTGAILGSPAARRFLRWAALAPAPDIMVGGGVLRLLRSFLSARSSAAAAAAAPCVCGGGGGGGGAPTLP